MSTLAEWQSFARSTGLKGWSRMKKNELVDFLMQNLWFGGGKPTRWHHKNNPLMKKNKKIPVPVLIPKKRLVSAKIVPKKIGENVENVVDWAKWLESVEDAEIRKKSTPAVEKLKKEIEKLWKESLTVEKGKTALNGFTRQFIIRGDDSLSPQEFFLKARGLLVGLLKQNPRAKTRFVLNLRMMRLEGEEEIFDEPFFHSQQHVNLGIEIDLINEMEKELMEMMENFNSRGSNWNFEKVIRLEIHFSGWKPLGGSRWIPLPPALAAKKAVINMKNEKDDECFKWCVGRAKFPVDSHPELISLELREQVKVFDWTGCNFPMKLNRIKFFEVRNPEVSINVYGWNGSVEPLRISEEEKKFHVDLLLIVEDFKSHFCLIKNFSRLVSSQMRFRNRRHRVFCKRCLNSFISDKSLQNHKEICGKFKEAKIETPGGVCSFSNYQKMMHVPVVGYADFESILKPTGKKDQTHEHLPCGFAFHLVSPFLQMEPFLKRGENESENLGEKFILEIISAVRNAHLSLPKKEMDPLTKLEWKKFREAQVCWLCRKEFGDENLRKVRDHCHYSGKFRGAAHQSCNLKFQRPKFTPVFFHNLQNYDSHLFVRAMGLVDEVLDLKCIPNNDEKYICFSFKFQLEKDRKHEIRFLDSFKFLKESLSELVGNLLLEDLKETSRFLGEKSFLVSQRDFIPMNSWMILKNSKSNCRKRRRFSPDSSRKESARKTTSTRGKFGMNFPAEIWGIITIFI